MKVIWLDIVPEGIARNKPTEVPLVGPEGPPEDKLLQVDRRAIERRPKDTPWRKMITKKAKENAAMIRPQIHNDEVPANYYHAFRDVAA
jgi:hypothetical protein